MGKKLKQLMTEKLKVWFGGCFFLGGGEGREGCFLFWSPPPPRLWFIFRITVPETSFFKMIFLFQGKLFQLSVVTVQGDLKLFST